jgi:hypothetical protein
MHPHQSPSSPLSPRQMLIPKAMDKSRYHSGWETYIAANLFVYLVPFAIFLRRAREMDFSTSSTFNRSYQVLRRVFRVFTPDVVAALSRIAYASSSLAHESTCSPLTTQLTKCLGPYAPPPGGGFFSLASCQADFRSLLEEIYSHYQKRARERGIVEKMAACIENFFLSRGFGAASFESEERMIKRLVDDARLIGQFPIEDQIVGSFVSSEKENGFSKTNEYAFTDSPLRNEEGMLTAQGSKLAMTGAIKCDPLDVHFRGDPMLARPGSYEIVALVELTVWISQEINQRLGLKARPSKSHHFLGFDRINLRFFADYRNLLFIAVLTYFGQILLF